LKAAHAHQADASLSLSSEKRLAAFKRSHHLLHAEGLLPLPHQMHSTAAKTADNCLARRAHERFLIEYAHHVPQNVERCLGWDASMVGLLQQCSKRKTFSFRFESDANAPFPRTARYNATSRTVRGDLNSMTSIARAPRQQFGFILASEVFEHVSRPFDGMRALYNMASPGGIVMWSAPFMERFHKSPQDYYRYTCDGAREIFEAAGFEVVARKQLGNREITSAFLLGMTPQDFDDDADLDRKLLADVAQCSGGTCGAGDTYMGCAVLARKPTHPAAASPAKPFYDGSDEPGNPDADPGQDPGRACYAECTHIKKCDADGPCENRPPDDDCKICEAECLYACYPKPDALPAFEASPSPSPNPYPTEP